MNDDKRTPEEAWKDAWMEEEVASAPLEADVDPELKEAAQNWEIEQIEAWEAFKALKNNPGLIRGGDLLVKRYLRQQFLIGPALLPRGGRMLLTAENGTGKSVIALYMAACILLGKPLFGFTQTKKEKDFGKAIFPTVRIATTLYLDYETPEAIRAETRLKPLAKALDESFKGGIFFPKRPSDFRLENGRADGEEGAFNRLLKLVSDGKPQLLIIDPLSSTHSLDENSNQIKQALNNIDRLIDHSGTTVILVHHESTKKARNAQGQEVEKGTKEKARGHSCLTDWADVHLSIEEVKEKGHHEAKTKTLNLSWGKTRYCKKPYDREIAVNFETMEITPKLRNED